MRTRGGVLCFVVALGCGVAATGISQTAPLEVRITVSGAGSVEVTGAVQARCESTCSVPAAAGSTLTLSAIPAPGSEFAAWSGACAGVAPCTLALESSEDVTATFVAQATPPLDPPSDPPPGTASLTIEHGGDGAGTVTTDPERLTCSSSCTGTFQRGTLVKVTARAAEGSSFAGWDGPCSGTSVCELLLDADVTVTARFERAPRPPHYSAKVLRIDGGTLHMYALTAGGDAVGSVHFPDACCSSPQAVRYLAARDEIVHVSEDERASRALDVSPSGAVIVLRSDRSDADYLFEEGSFTPLAPLQAWDVNDAGWVAGVAPSASGIPHAHVHDGRTLRDLDPESDRSSEALALNASGLAVGLRGDTAVAFERGGVRELGAGRLSCANDVADTGLVVGSGEVTFEVPHFAFTMDLATGKLTRVPPLPGYDGISLSRVNPSGTIAVGTIFGKRYEAVVYVAGEVRLLKDLVDLPRGWSLKDVADVNDSGQILVSVTDDRGWPQSAILSPD